MLWFLGNNYAQKDWSDIQKLEYSMKLHKELDVNYEMVCKMFIVCLKRKIRLVMENPQGRHHYLNKFFPIKPAILDNDRTERGDYLRKPTQFWFVNFKPYNNFIFEMTNYNALPIRDAINSLKKDEFELLGADNKRTARSMMHPDYANRFIREFLIESNQPMTTEELQQQMPLFNYGINPYQE